MAVLSATYSFAEANRGRWAVPWTGVRRELRRAAALIPLAFRRLDSPLSPVVGIFHASTWGSGVMQKHVEQRVVEDATRYNER